MSPDDLLLVLDHEIDLSKEFIFNTVARERAQAYDLYYRKPLGNEVEGRSSVVTADVAMAIDTTVPALMEMFVASDKAVEFTPKKAEDVEGAEQATDLANHVFYSQNRGFQLTYNCLHDGLTQKTGALKWRWEKSVDIVVETYMGLNDQQFVMLQQDPEIEIVAYAQSQIGMSPGQPLPSHDVQVKKKKESGKVKIESIPVDELLISPRSRGYDVYESPFTAHAPLLTYSELIELGVSADLLEDTDGDDLSLSEVVTTRNERLGIIDKTDDSPDPTQRMYRYYECYIRVDFDGDGVSELRKICKVGSHIVHNDAVDHIPLAYWCPKTMPHEPVGMSMADDVGDIQLLNTTLLRAGLDGTYATIAPRLMIDVDANSGLPTVDDALTVRPGGIIRCRAGSVAPLQQGIDLGAISNLIEFARQEGDQRTGAYRYGQGLDPNAMNKTATVANLQSSSMQSRLKIYGRNFAEQCLIPCFKGVMYLLGKNQTEALTTRLRNKFVAVDPRVWTTEYDMSVNVGLGTGTKEQQFMALMQLSSDQALIAQSPFAQQLLTAKNIFNTQSKKCELAGYKDAEQFFSDPDKMPPPQPQKPPEIQKAEMQIAADQQKHKAQMDMDGQKMQAEHAMKGQELQQEQQLKERELMMEMMLKRMEVMMEMQLEKMKIQMMAGVQERVGLANAAATASRPESRQ